MVPGLNAFRDWFEGYHGRHVIIGGTACNLIYAQYGAPERATKDIDLVVLAEAFDRSYFERFVSFVRAGGYEHRTKSGRYELYRFERPANKDFPPKIENRPIPGGEDYAAALVKPTFRHLPVFRGREDSGVFQAVRRGDDPHRVDQGPGSRIGLLRRDGGNRGKSKCDKSQYLLHVTNLFHEKSRWRQWLHRPEP